MSKNAHVSWDDLIYVLAVADHGSVSAAARALSVNHATVLRRIASFEKTQGLRIFDKSPRGYQVLPDRRRLIETMRQAGEALAEVGQMIGAERPRLCGGLRITSTDTLAQFVLPPVLSGLSEALNTHVEVLADNSWLDFSRMEAHVTVRPTPRLPREMVGEQVGVIRFAIYGAPCRTPGWLGLSGPLARSLAGAWLRGQGGDTLLTADSFVMLAALASQGRGRTILPTFLGDRWAGLERLALPDDIAPVPVWVAAHVDFASSGRISKARKFIAKAMNDMDHGLR